MYNLEKRTSDFGIKIISLCKSIKINIINKNTINQVIRSGTSIGANYHEANDSSSKRDFKNKIFICKKETNETKYWLKMLYSSELDNRVEIQKLYQESQQLNMIFQKIVNSLNKK
ncbi:MAG: four helix bundle protein [Patescibacteria group bacterium]